MITKITTPSAINAYLQYPLEGTGVQADPFDWFTVDTVVDTTSAVTVVETGNYDSVELYFNAKLTASQLYTFSIGGVDEYATTVTIYYEGNQVAQSTSDPWALAYTPSATGTYLIKVAAYAYGSAGTLSVTPVPGEITPWIEKANLVYASTGFDADKNNNLPRRYTSAFLAGLVVEPPPSAPNDLTANDSNPEWFVSASSSYNEGTSPYKAFNGNDGSDDESHWMTTGSGSGWISWRNLNKKILVRRYSLNATPEVGYEARSARNWTLEGSDDGETWTVIHTVTNGFGSNAPTPYQLTNHTVPSGNSAYFYHRLNITSAYSYDYLSIGQIQAWPK